MRIESERRVRTDEAALRDHVWRTSTVHGWKTKSALKKRRTDEKFGKRYRTSLPPARLTLLSPRRGCTIKRNEEFPIEFLDFFKNKPLALASGFVLLFQDPQRSERKRRKTRDTEGKNGKKVLKIGFSFLKKEIFWGKFKKVGRKRSKPIDKRACIYYTCIKFRTESAVFCRFEIFLGKILSKKENSK